MSQSILIYTILPFVGGSATIASSLTKFFLREGIKVTLMIRQQAYGFDEATAAKLAAAGATILVIGSRRSGWRDHLAPLEAIFLARRSGCSTLLSVGMGRGAVVLSKWGGFKQSYFYYINHDPEAMAVKKLGPGVASFTAVLVISPASIGPVKSITPKPRDVRWIAQYSKVSEAVDAPRKDGHLRFGYVGALKHSKGVGLLLKFWKKNEAFGELLILGDGPLRSDVEEASAKDSRIRFCGGFLAHEREIALPKFINEVDYLVVPSIGHGEGIPTVILEALSLGCPVIATDGGGTRAFGDPPLADDFKGIVTLVAEFELENALIELTKKQFQNFPDKLCIRSSYSKWFDNDVLDPQWRQIVAPVEVE